jgi:ABC transport system ATP-binding/permease protein
MQRMLDLEPPRVATRPSVRVAGVSQHARGRQILHDISFSIVPGELVAIAGGSGAGKTTLLKAMAGLRRPTAGSVALAPNGANIGFVPQEDIVHRELPLRRTLRYAAQLRLPAATTAAEIDAVVDRTLRDLDLLDRADVRVADLSGGQRKRASIGVELLTRPEVFFLDEPTSGLDPATSAEVLAVLRRLADTGVTVVLTTHAPAELDHCDRVVFLARDGHLAFAGSPEEARSYFAVSDLSHVYSRLSEAPPQAWAARWSDLSSEPRSTRLPDVVPSADRPPTVGAVCQWRVLVRRNADVLARNRLTLGVLLGSPVLVIAMMSVLFRPGAFESVDAGSTGPVQMVFWVAFAGFFFGLTYGLLQIVGELPVFRREHRAGLGAGAYVAAKITVLLPILTVVAALLLGVLRLLGRLPDAGWHTYGLLLATLVAESLCALSLGLLASALVHDAAQATLALPMICFPQVLFSGAVLPIVEMAAPGRLLSVAMANRWAFESLARGLELSAIGEDAPAIAAFGDAFQGSAATGWLVLLAVAAACAVATVRVLRRRSA